MALIKVSVLIAAELYLNYHELLAFAMQNSVGVIVARVGNSRKLADDYY